jgi:hypothetical protein
MQAHGNAARPTWWLFVVLGLVGMLWAVPAVVCWLGPTAITRGLLLATAGLVLLAGFGWYCAARGAGSGRSAEPLALLVFAWLLCLGSALAATLAPRTEREPGPPVPHAEAPPAGIPAPTTRKEEPRPQASKKEQEAPPPPRPKLPPSKLFPKGPVRFLSEMPEFAATAMVKDNADTFHFGKGECGNGQPIMVHGVLSPHGLGMHPPFRFGDKDVCTVKYHLDREAALFKGTAAINDTTKWCWSPAIFTVWGDGLQLWKSEMLAHNHSHSQECTVPVSGVSVLELRVQAWNGNAGIHAVWLEPRLLQEDDRDRDPPRLFAMGPKRFLADLGGFDMITGLWPIRKGDCGNGVPIVVKGLPSPQGLGMHPPDGGAPERDTGIHASAKYRLRKQAVMFRAMAALNDTSQRTASPAIFTVYGDGRLLWQSAELTDRNRFQKCRVDVTGVDVLELRVRCKGGQDGVEAVWFQPRVVEKADTPDR